jgi:hypothetical protein
VTVSKDASVESLLGRLRADLGNNAFTVIDHWDGDLCAIGVARPADPRYLVYISTWPPERGTFAYECERPPTDAAMPSESDGMIEGASYDAMRDAVRRHLRE